MTCSVGVLQALVERVWLSVPIFAARPMRIEFRFKEDGGGRSRYARWDAGPDIPAIDDYFWRYTIEGNVLRIAWEVGGKLEVPFELFAESHRAFNPDGDETDFDAVLRVKHHLFPPAAAFPDGWLKDYWGTQLPTETTT